MGGGAYSNRAVPDGGVPDARGKGLILDWRSRGDPGLPSERKEHMDSPGPRVDTSPLTVLTTSRHGVVWIVVRGERTCSPAIN